MHKFNLIIVVVLIGAVKIYVAALEALEALGKRKRQDETQFCEFHPPHPFNANVLFLVSF